VWFGEAVPKIEDAIMAMKGIDAFVIIGTSLNVYPAAGLLNYVPYGVPVYLIDPNEVTVNGVRDVVVIRKGASEGMRVLIDEYLNKIK
jgi:NAD-dependent deacetylase